MNETNSNFDKFREKEVLDKKNCEMAKLIVVGESVKFV